MWPVPLPSCSGLPMPVTGARCQQTPRRAWAPEPRAAVCPLPLSCASLQTATPNLDEACALLTPHRAGLVFLQEALVPGARCELQ